MMAGLRISFLAASLAFLTAMPVRAQTPAPAPDWKACNETSFVLRVATATMIDGAVVPRGWTRIRPGGCHTVETAPGLPRYVYAESSRAYQGGIREWKGNAPLCTADDDFIADSNQGCEPQNMQTRLYLPVDPSEPVTTFVEAEDYGGRAEIAGLQRLLRDNGYTVSRIDGVSGRRTLRTAAKFLSDNKLPADSGLIEQIDLLEETALKRLQTIGLTLCNNASSRIWAAIGQRRGDDWESRGWWPIEAGDCAQPAAQSLIGQDVHFYARQEAPPLLDESGLNILKTSPDKALRVTATTPSQFCITEARFSALGRENCSDSGYRAASFRALPLDKEGVKISLSDSDFAAPSASGLRR